MWILDLAVDFDSYPVHKVVEVVDELDDEVDCLL